MSASSPSGKDAPQAGPRGMRGAWWSATLEPLITSIEPASVACDGHGVDCFSAELASTRKSILGVNCGLNFLTHNQW